MTSLALWYMEYFMSLIFTYPDIQCCMYVNLYVDYVYMSVYMNGYNLIHNAE